MKTGKVWPRRLGILIFWLLMWQLLAVAVDNPILMVTPVTVFRAFLALLPQVEFWRTLLTSLGHIGLGLLLGILAAFSLAVLAHRLPFVRELLAPVIGLIKTMPVASFVVLLLIWWGARFLSVIISFLVVLPGIYLNTLQGLENVDGRLVEMAEVFRIRGWLRFLYIYRPALVPFLKSSLKVALGMCWKAGVAAELIGTPSHTIGERLYLSKLYLETENVLAWTAVIILLSFGFERVILWLAESFFRWEPAHIGSRTRREEHRGEHREETETDEAKSGAMVCRGVAKSYGDTVIYRDLTLDYEPGSVHFLTGASGSGKTTLLRLLAGLEAPDGGELERTGRVSVLFQEDRLCEEYSALRNVALVTGDEAAAGEALEKLLGPDVWDKPCKALSGGMKRRVALVRAMEAPSEIVLLDEPFTGMDEETRLRAEEYIRERRRGRTMVIASHIPPEKLREI